jgi:transcription-repair coupling factor (superfamily II helicase)
MAAGMGMKEIQQQESQIILYPETLDIARVGNLASRMKGRVLVNAGMKPYFTVRLAKGQGPIEAIREALSNMAEK